jgi:ABC-type uncharacterized transport system ATPase component
MSETLSPLAIIQNEIHDIKEYLETFNEHKEEMERLFVYKTSLNKPMPSPLEILEVGQECLKELTDFLENTKERLLLPIYEKHLANVDPKEKEEIIANKEQLIEHMFNDLLKKKVERIQKRPIKFSEITSMIKDEEYMKSLFKE